MKQLKVDYHEGAQEDLQALYDWIAAKSGPQTVTIAFVVEDERVVILRLFCGGQN